MTQTSRAQELSIASESLDLLPTAPSQGHSLCSWWSSWCSPELRVHTCARYLHSIGSNPCLLSWWGHPIISSSVFFFCFQSFPASGSLAMSWLFIWGGQSVGASASAADLPVNIQDWFPLGLTSLISLLPNYSQESSPRPQFKGIHFLALRRLCDPNLSYVHDYWKKQSIDNMGLCHQIMSLLFNTSSRFVIAFLPRSKHLLISWLQSPSSVISEPKKICHCFYFSLFYLPWSDGTRCHDLSFLNVELRPAFSLSSFTLIKRLFTVLWPSAIGVSFAYLR